MCVSQTPFAAKSQDQNLCPKSVPKVCAQNPLPNSFPAKRSDDRLWLGAKIGSQARGQHVHSEHYDLMSLFGPRGGPLELGFRVRLE